MPLPDRLGRLERVEVLGVGGFATVWRFHDPELECDVAVKALAENWAQRLDVRERFLDEARILRRAASDHVVAVHDVGETDGVPWFVMTYADRGTVADLLDDGPLAPSRVNDLVTQAGAGLATLHEHGVVHRDVKPQNLLLRDAGGAGDRVLVADLGVAKALLHASGLTQVVGTPSYMAPEQALGLGVDVRADVHALGAVAYHLLTGEVVREGTVGSLARAELPRAPSGLLPTLTGASGSGGEDEVDRDALDVALLGALAPDPDDRWPDVPSFVLALREALPEPERTARGTVTMWARPPLVPGRAGATTLPAGRRATLLLALLVLLAAFGTSYFAVTLLA